MDKLRGAFTKVFLFVLFGLLIISFAFWGVGDMLQQGGDAPVVAEVGDERIEEQVFRRELSETMSLLSRRMGSQVDLEMAQALGLPQQVLQRLVTDKLITAEAQARGLLVTDEQVRQAIYANEAFRDSTGTFSRGRFEQTLMQARLTEAGYVAELREQLLQEQLSMALGAAIEPPALLVETLYRRQAEQRRADWVELAVSAQPETPLPGEAELRAYYEANSQAFMAPTYRSLSYLWLQPEDLYDEVSVEEARLREEYEDNLDAYVEPERRTISQAVYDDAEAAEAAYDRVQEGEDYEAVVRETTGGAPVPLGTLPRGAQPADLREAALAA
ncbi:MAG: SurA N-terminal domain-containing protein, partial [Tistlia sp.]